jgi:hypothetical protein
MGGPNGGPRPFIDRGRSYKELEGSSSVDIYDLDFAAYLLMRGVALAEAFRNGREFLFRFYDPESQIPKLSVEFTNSESARFGESCRRLKKVVYSVGSRWDGENRPERR